VSPLERLLLREHEERIVAARPVDLPMSPSALAAKGSRSAGSASREAERKRRVQRAARDAVLAANDALWERAVELLRTSRWEAVAEALGISVRALAQHQRLRGKDAPEHVRRARADYDARCHALRLAYYRQRAASKARAKAKAVSRG